MEDNVQKSKKKRVGQCDVAFSVHANELHARMVLSLERQSSLLPFYPLTHHGPKLQLPRHCPGIPRAGFASSHGTQSHCARYTTFVALCLGKILKVVHTAQMLTLLAIRLW